MSAVSTIANGIARRTTKSTRREPGAAVLLTLTSAFNTVAGVALLWENPSPGGVPDSDARI
jgi:hypothetical protein